MTPADGSNSTITPGAQRPKRGVRTGETFVPPSNVDQTLTRRMEAAVADLERLRDEIIARLDELDRDPDLEDGGDDEPTLGAPEPLGGTISCQSGGSLNQRTWTDGYEGAPAADEREPDPDSELNLGGLGDAHQQREWGAQGSWDDREGEHDGREPEDDSEPCCEDEGAQCEDEGARFDDEPSLGWMTQGNQGPRVGTLPNGPDIDIIREASHVGDEHL